MCPNKHSQDSEILLDYCAGTLDPRKAVEFEAHARQCAECARLIAAQRVVVEALDQWTPPEVSPDFDARLYARIARQKGSNEGGKDAPRPWQLQWWSLLSKPVLVTSLACAVLAIGLLVRMPRATDVPQQVRTETVDIDQVDATLEDLDMLTPQTAVPANRM